jgi:cytochrome c biogenesis protein CcmG/thiol:disulfide interchange protein DsbE
MHRAPRCLGFVVAALTLSAAAASAAVPRIGERAPPLIVREFSGRMFDLARDRGRVVVVSFWATWCSPCHAEMPVLQSFYRRFHRRGVTLIALSIDRSASRARIEQALRGFTYPAALARTARADGFGEPLAVPMTYVIDTHGVIRARLLGGLTGLTAGQLALAVRPLLAVAHGRRP